MSAISFKSDGYKLAGNLFIPEGNPKNIAFLFIQGWTGHQNTLAAQVLTKLGYITMTYDMRGNRDSEGNIANFSRADFIKDATVAYDFLKQEVGPETKIGVIGSSFGGYTAILLSEKRDVSCMSLRVPANYPDEGFNKPQQVQHESGEFEEWRKKKLSFSENHTLKALHNFKGKVQIIEAEKDEMVDAQVPKNYADAIDDKSHLTYDLLVGAPHRLATPELQAEFEKMLVAWVTSL